MMRLEVLPRFAAVSALVVWGVTLPLLAVFHRTLNEPATLAFVVGIGMATLINLFAQNPKLAQASWLLWLSAGIWTAAAYLNPEVIGFTYFLVALLTLGSAAVRERAIGPFLLGGPLLFLAAMILLIVVDKALATH